MLDCFGGGWICDVKDVLRELEIGVFGELRFTHNDEQVLPNSGGNVWTEYEFDLT
jgi:hypothetical protein